MSSQGWVRIALRLHLMVLALPGWLLKVAQLCKGAGDPMGCLTYRPMKAWEASPHLLPRCGIVPRGAWHTSAKEAPAWPPPPRSPCHGSAGKRGHRATTNRSSASPLVSISFFYEAISKLHTAVILLEVRMFPAVYLPGAPSCNPLISPRLQSCVVQMLCGTKARGCVSAQQAAVHATLRNKTLRNSLSPVWA